MRCEIVRVRRRPGWPGWAVGVVSLWAALMLAATWLHSWTGKGQTLCWFHRVTHLPCPTCGLTRGMIALYHGHWLTPWTLNPLMFTLLAIYSLLLLVRIVTGYSIRLHPSPRQAQAGWAILATVFLANWAYLIYAGV